MDSIKERAEKYVKEHVIYADDKGRFENHLDYLANNPEAYPEARTCDGCDKDSIAVYQTYIAAGKSELEKFVDSLKEWCDIPYPENQTPGYQGSLQRQGHAFMAYQLYEFAVQRLELVKEGK